MTAWRKERVADQMRCFFSYRDSLIKRVFLLPDRAWVRSDTVLRAPSPPGSAWFPAAQRPALRPLDRPPVSSPLKSPLALRRDGTEHFHLHSGVGRLLSRDGHVLYHLALLTIIASSVPTRHERPGSPRS